MIDSNEKYKAYMKSDKWRRIAAERMKIDGYQCQGCGCRGTAANPLEVHHLSYRNLYREELTIYEDLVTVCRSCHKTLHKILERITSKSGRRGWRDSPRIPSIHVFNINGIETEIKEGKADEF